MKEVPMKLLLFTLTIFCALASVASAARFDASFSFSTIETRHFSIHYHQGLETVARKTSRIAEEAHEKLLKSFSWDPPEKTEIVLVDNSDFLNGSALVLPYNVIVIQVVPPTFSTMLGEFDDWLKTVITHEYGHIVTMDPSRGYSSFMRSLFGKPVPGADPVTELLFLVTAPPNNLLPRWWHEGIATWVETEHTGTGRGKSSYYDMVYRMAVAENNIPTIAQINGDVPDWPGGGMRYLFGYKLFQYVADTYGSQSLNKLSTAHSGRIPYALHTPPATLFDGKGYPELYSGMVSELYREQSQRIAALSSVPFTPVRTVAKDGQVLMNPRYSPSGSLIAYLKSDPHDHVSCVITDREGNKKYEFRRSFSDGSPTWSPSGDKLYFSQPRVTNGFDMYQDLFSYELSSKKTSRLTHGMRIGDVDLSPQGERFAAVVNGKGSQNLALLDVKGTTISAPEMITSYSMQRLFSPRWSPNGTTVSYGVTDNNGISSIHLYDVVGKSDITILSSPHVTAFPVWSRDGSAIYYISDENGVFNLYSYDLRLGTSTQLSHLLGGAMQPEPSPDGSSILFSSYGSHGFTIAEMSLDPANVLTVAAPSVSRSERVVPPTQPVAKHGEASLKGGISQPYSPLHTLLPRFWLPKISGDGSNGAVVGLYTAGADVLGYNRYFLNADYSFGRNRGYFDFDYRNDNFYPTLLFKARSEPFQYASLLQNGDYYELNQAITVGTIWPVNFFESRFSVTAGYQLLDVTALSGINSNSLINGLQVFQGRQDNLYAGIGFSSVRRYPYSVSPEEGSHVSLLYRRYSRLLGGDLDQSQYTASYEEYFRIPTESPRHNVVYLRLAGAFADTRSNYAQQAFQLGGIPSELNPYSLRGFPSRIYTGKYITTGTLEFRAPISYPMGGAGVFPYFFEKLHLALFLDGGEVWNDQTPASLNSILAGAGAEVRMDVITGYWLKLTPAIGVAHGLSKGGENQLYFTIYMNM